MEDNFELGVKKYNENKFYAAIDFFKKVEPGSSNYQSALYNMGVSYIRLYQHEKAIGAFQKALKVQPSHRNAIFNIAYCCSVKGDMKSALRYFNLAWAMDNTDSDCEKAIKVILQKINNENKKTRN